MKKPLSNFFLCFCKRWGLFALLLFSLLPAFPAFSAKFPDIVPERSLKITTNSSVSAPDWRKKWQFARGFVQRGKCREALPFYVELLQDRPELEAVRWEYCQLLVFLGHYKEAGREIEELKAFSPNTPEYQLVAGQIALHDGRFEKAGQSFGAVLEMAPEGELVAIALKGLAESLRLQGKKQLSLSLEEQQMANSFAGESKLSLLDDALAVKHREKVSWILQHLFSLQLLSRDQLQAIVALFAREKGLLKKKELSARIRVYTELLRREPQASTLRKAYISFLEKNKRFTDALFQFDLLLDYETDIAPLLLSAAAFAIEKAQSPEKALMYYKRHQMLVPDNKEIAIKIKELYKLLAREFLPIVENEGYDTLWLDIKELGRSRQEIFLQMVAILKKRGTKESLQLSVCLLEFLVKQKSDLSRVFFVLAETYIALGNEKKALATLERIPASLRGANFYRKKAEFLQDYGNESGAIEAYSRLLEKNPQERNARIKAIALCDALGLIPQAVQFFTFYDSVGKEGGERRPPLESILLHLYFLGESGEFDSLREMADWAASLWKSESSVVTAIRLEEARALRKMKMFDRAEQVLRKQLNSRKKVDSVLIALAATAAERGRLQEMEQWFRLLKEGSLYRQKKQFSLITKEKRWWRDLIKTRFFLQRQNLQRAAQFLDAGIAQDISAEGNVEVKREVASLCQLVEQMQAEELYSFCRATGEFPATAWGDAPFSLYTKEQKKAAANKKVEASSFLSMDLFAAKQYVAQRAWHKAEEILLPLKEKLSSSLFIVQLLADSAIEQKEYERAKKLISGSVGGVPLHCRTEISIAQQEGRFDQALSLFRSCYGREESDNGSEEDSTLAARLFARGEPEKGVLLARLLWRARKYSESLAAYCSILATPVAEQIMELHKQEKDVLYPEQSFWGFFSVFRSSRELQRQSYQALLSPILLAENLGTPVGMMLADSSHLLFFQKTLLQEYDARMASFEKRLFYAERSYRTLLAEEGASDVAGDLAAIYERMGQYQKEARLYRDLQRKGGLSAVLEKSMVRNARKISPFVEAEVSLMKKRGHRQHQDIERADLGGSFNYLLDLEKGLHFYYKNQQYRAHYSNGKIDADKMGIDINCQFSENNQFVGGAGIDSQDGNINLFWHGRIDSQLDDLVTGFIGAERFKITDTIASMEALEIMDKISLGLLFEAPSGIIFGGDMRYKIRSDGNNGKEFHGTLLYSLFYERGRMEVGYDIYREENDRQDKGTDEGLLQVPEKYWSPEGNTCQTITGGIRHTFRPFWRAELLGTQFSAPAEGGFLVAKAGVGVEEDDIFYFTNFDISLEISPYFLLKGNLDFLSGDDREEASFSAGVQYRW